MDSPDTSIVVFGSLARGEWTPQSDLDWTLLVDGAANKLHLDAAIEIERRLTEARYKLPTQEGPFGALAFSHELVHFIGGERDTNINTTRRVLLLLESRPIHRREAHRRVVRGILSRYIGESRVFVAPPSDEPPVPRFLINDIAKFWRIMAVDYANKYRTRGAKGWATRNVKLRLSRKLLFAVGLLICFECRLHPSVEIREACERRQDAVGAVATFLERLMMREPLDLLAEALIVNNRQDLARDIFESYEEFLGVLSDAARRAELDGLEPGGSSPVSKTMRDCGKRFEGGLLNLFFETPVLAPLTREFGVF